jgi:prophage regulatory protein
MATQILKLPEVQLKTGLSRTSVYRLELAGKFPRRIRIGDGHAVGWYLHEIEEWIESRPRVADAPKAGVN